MVNITFLWRHITHTLSQTNRAVGILKVIKFVIYFSGIERFIIWYEWWIFISTLVPNMHTTHIHINLTSFIGRTTHKNECELNIQISLQVIINLLSINIFVVWNDFRLAHLVLSGYWTLQLECLYRPWDIDGRKRKCRILKITILYQTLYKSMYVN